MEDAQVCGACGDPIEIDEGRECGDCKTAYHTENGTVSPRAPSCFDQHTYDNEGCGYEYDGDDYL